MSGKLLKNILVASGVAASLLIGAPVASAQTHASVHTAGFSVAAYTKAPVVVTETPKLAVPASVTYSTGARIANYIQAHDMGKPYVYGATGPYSFDCSGLTMSAAHAVGAWWMPRVADDQYRHLTRVYTPRYGDFVFFHNGSGTYHVGVYIGTYWFQGARRMMMVAAPHTGSYVKREGIYYPGAGYVTFGRP
jgi:cell wall-associated NlpC family hydrolase